MVQNNGLDNFALHAKGDVVSDSITAGNKILEKAQCGLATDFDLVINILGVGFPGLQKAKSSSPILLKNK